MKICCTILEHLSFPFLTSGAAGLFANGAKVINPGIDVSNGRLVILENYLFAEDLTDDHSFLQDMTEVLSFLQSGVRVFQHLLARSNVTRLLSQGKYMYMSWHCSTFNANFNHILRSNGFGNYKNVPFESAVNTQILHFLRQ